MIGEPPLWKLRRSIPWRTRKSSLCLTSNGRLTIGHWKALEDIESKLSSTQMGRKYPRTSKEYQSVCQLLKDFEEWRDWLFSSKEGQGLNMKIRQMNTEIRGHSAKESQKESLLPYTQKLADYQRKTWVTRKKRSSTGWPLHGLSKNLW